MATRQRTYRAAIIGNTKRGNYGHGLDICFSGLPDVEVVAVADPDPAGREAAQARSGATSSYADYRQMLDRERPDLVSIAPRVVGERLAMITAAAEAGCHLYVEKPLAATLTEADEILAICRRNGVRLAVAHQLRLLPSVLFLQRLLAEERIGPVRQIRGTGKMDHRGGHEEFVIIANHYLDLMRLYAGDAHWCSADLLSGSRLATDADARPGVDEIGPVLGDGLFAVYGFDHDVIGGYEVFRDLGAESGQASFGIDVVGEGGRLTMRGDFEKRLFFHPHPYPEPGVTSHLWERIEEPPEPETESSAGTAVSLQHQANHRLVRDLISAIEEDREPASSGARARAALELVLAVPAAHAAGGRVALPLAVPEPAAVVNH
jgi:predicted dehydrogenase